MEAPPSERFQPFIATEWIEGEIRHRRKLYRKLFFIDLLLPTDGKVQVLFRCDDGSMSTLNHQDCLRLARPGHKVRLHVGPPTDPTESQGRPFKVWQCTTVPEITQAYNQSQPFITDPPLMNKKHDTIKQWNGEEKLKKDLPCKYWLNQRKCYRIDTCPFQHPTGPDFEKARETWVQERIEIRKIITCDPNDPHQDKKPHALRALIFAQWIYEQLLSKLKPNMDDMTVLDIAGGKGEVSMFLCHAFGIPSTVVEPQARPQPKYWFTRLRRLMEKHIMKEETSYAQSWPYPNLKPTFLTTLLDDRFLQQYHDLMLQVTLLIGLHADQATEPIVDTAIQLGKPFAVVPCCVFGRENLHRRLISGAPVATTKDLIQYLCEKDTGVYGGKIQTAYLDFEGKNQVVYWIPSSLV
ncbi:uncharacterized protein BX664DRAFT_324552 [Halteromyces radiatus]|uniref:uncharacterized protein n=1 Tax=Halteromyces radiatus TaxID=101107 RepID=UPI00221F1909|nr:uncharacterized protein BX664DRAFT_324552 [Halteromyces radiatus]KAI8096657.1 hypothetical protein BX664DRAFT_324552 [Halteromyces radiatus]